ncbi:MAG: hypothetical protein AAF696_22745 [Bacteroidota bacterium]
MGQLNFSNISDTAGAAMLRFLNQAFRPQDIINRVLIKDESEGKDYGIGAVVAGRIIRKRKTLPRWRFTELSQLNDIKGFGQDKLEDLAETFSLNSAERLLYIIRTSPILYENFPFTYWAITFEDDKSFKAATESEDRLRSLVKSQISNLSTRQELSNENQQKAQDQIQHAYIEEFNTAFLGAYAWAVWFYGFDADNWFGFDQMRIPLEAYLSESDAEPMFYLFKGFENSLITRGITVLDLPVVVNPAEKTVYLWTAELFD